MKDLKKYADCRCAKQLVRIHSKEATTTDVMGRSSRLDVLPSPPRLQRLGEIEGKREVSRLGKRDTNTSFLISTCHKTTTSLVLE
jgi:hypothetical protein